MPPLDRQHALDDLAGRFADGLDQFVEESTRRQLAATELAGCDREVALALRESTARGAELLAMALRSPSAATGPVEANPAPMARTAAAHDIPLATVLRGYRLSHAVAVDHVLAHAGRAGTPMTIVCEAVRNVFWHMDAIVGIGSRTYIEERRRINSRPERARFLRIKSVLDGAGELGIPYPLEAHHVAIVLRSPAPAPTLAAIADATAGAPMLACEAPDGKVWAWVACRVCEGDIVAVLRDRMRGPVAAGVSGHEPGAAGFRAAHRKAQLALRLGSTERNAVTTFAEVALEALAVGGEDLGREFVAAEMGALTGGDRRTSVARETLTAYFACGGAAAAGRQLRVSERTVTYRLRHAEMVLGRSLTVRRAELEMALRLHHLLSVAARAA